MPKTQRTPPQGFNVDTIRTPEHSPTHYGSDSDLNLSSTGTVKHDSLLNITKRAKRKFSDTPGCSADHLNEFRQMFEKLQSHQEAKFATLNSSIQTLIEQNTEIRKTVDFMSSQYDTLVNKIESVENENKDLKSHIKSLEQKVDALEKDSKSTSIELRNLPKLEQEDKHSLCNTIININTAVGSTSTLQESEIRNIYRTKTEAIVVEFTTTSRKEDLVQKYKIYNKEQRHANQPQLNTVTLNIPGPKKTVFLSEALTTKARRLYYLTRELVKNHKIVATWTSYGKVFIRKEENTPPVRVFDEGELANIVS
ncbi:uncharacterized protein LOC114352433 [Ostrinia furnacalis]|uniref:uncharacterized protein LOC114352433 n=1 Tax=Ostrinia furnacalis TaxID=93504 RepID=UPI00103FBE9A|nr:uncharacterized protein LOC114352433 [Ostrinia furnacalis]